MCRNCPKEFNEGDVGLAGGIQVSEPANANLVTEDSDFGFWENFYGFLVFFVLLYIAFLRSIMVNHLSTTMWGLFFSNHLKQI